MNVQARGNVPAARSSRVAGYFPGYATRLKNPGYNTLGYLFPDGEGGQDESGGPNMVHSLRGEAPVWLPGPRRGGRCQPSPVKREGQAGVSLTGHNPYHTAPGCCAKHWPGTSPLRIDAVGKPSCPLGDNPAPRTAPPRWRRTGGPCRSFPRLRAGAASPSRSRRGRTPRHSPPCSPRYGEEPVGWAGEVNPPTPDGSCSRCNSSLVSGQASCNCAMA